MGDTSPNLPQPPASGGGGCGGLGQILMVVVAVVVAVYAPQMLANSIPGLFAGAGEVGIGVAGYAAGAAAGSIASQLVGNAIGAVDGFNWQSVALAAISAGATAGLGGGDLLGTTTGTLSNAMVRAAVSNAMSQGIGVVVGLQPSFDWRSVAASAIGAGVSFGVGSALSGVDMNAYVKAGISSFAAGTAVAVANGGRVSIQQIATNSFNQVLADALAGTVLSAGVQEDRLGSFINEQMNAQDQRDMSGAQAAFRASEIAYQNENAPVDMGGAGGLRLGGGQGMRFSGSALSDWRNEVDGGITLTAQRDADIDAAQAAQRAQVRQAQTARAAAATTAANAGTSQEQAGAVYMAYGGRAARNTGSTAVGADRWRNYDDPVDLLGKPMTLSQPPGLMDEVIGVAQQIIQNPRESLHNAGQGVVGDVKGFVNGLPEMAVGAVKGWAYIGAASRDGYDSLTGAPSQNYLGRAIDAGNGYSGEVWKYEGDSQRIAGYVSGFASPGVYAKAGELTSVGLKALGPTLDTTAMNYMQRNGMILNAVENSGGVANTAVGEASAASGATRVLNSKGARVPYPSVEVPGYGEVPFPSGPYTPNNAGLRSTFTSEYKAQFKEWWTNQGLEWPEGNVNIHHIQPLSKGGKNLFENLVPLVQPEQHLPFTTWWRNYP